MQTVTYIRRFLLAAMLFGMLPSFSSPANAYQAPATASPAAHPETIEWVYRVRYGFHDEWFDLFRKYQLAILDRQKQLGYVLSYTVWAPSLHTSEESRWDYRIVITRASHDAPPGQSEAEVAKQLFPDQAAFRKDENRRWELTTNHWDLPIHEVDPNKAE
ncbi:hypothetical protein [Silvibacterium sp.]|uniref:hypothetical protein n=1 Tax=Silvibacterium sp. TaxID=1964179 RepID=UPI0039E491FF